MKKHGANDLVYVPVRLPQKLLGAIEEVQSRNQLVTRTAAVRLALVKGVEVLGVDLTSVEDGAA